MTRISKISSSEAADLFVEWREQFEVRGDVRIVFENMERELSPLDEEKFPALKSAVQVACFNAHLLKTSPDSDDFVSWRGQVASLRIQQLQLEGAIKVLQKALMAHPLALSIAIARGRVGALTESPLNGERTELATTLAEALTALDVGIPQLLALDRTERSVLNRVTGCLEYPKEIHLKRPKPDSAINGLVFELALLFKQWTSVRLPVVEIGCEWHEEGKPQYPLIADLVNVALDMPDCDFSSRKAMDRIRDLVSNHPGIRYIGWSNGVLAGGN